MLHANVNYRDESPLSFNHSVLAHTQKGKQMYIQNLPKGKRLIPPREKGNWALIDVVVVIIVVVIIITIIILIMYWRILLCKLPLTFYNQSLRKMRP